MEGTGKSEGADSVDLVGVKRMLDVDARVRSLYLNLGSR